MTDTTLNLASLRRASLKLVLAILWLQVPLIAVACWAVGVDMLVPLCAVLVVSVIAQIIARMDRTGDQARIVAGVSLMVSIAVLVGAMSGQKMQVDLHMYFFAALAVLAACCDWRVILAGAGAVALHHIGFNFLVPALVYPGGVDVGRLLIHVVILFLESTVLAWIAFAVERMFAIVSQAAERAEQSKLISEDSTRAALSASRDAASTHARNEQDRSRVTREDEVILESLARALKRLAEGDLVTTLDANLPQKVEALRANLNAAIDSLRSVMRSVAASAGNVRASAGEISNASEDLARRTEQQAASLEETAAALGQITATVRKNSAGASHAREVVGAAKADAETSSRVVRQAVEAMSGIEKSSEQIGQIIGVIDEIAFQTNLLALNAGVEAARAGDAGRGFAVVAQEVRALAQRSAHAAKEIKALIRSSSARVERGVELVDQTGKALEGFVVRVIEINAIVAQIAASVEEESQSLDQVNTAINQMDKVTQKNAAMVEQSTAASHALAQETESLTALISRFRIDSASTSARSPRFGAQRRPGMAA